MCDTKDKKQTVLQMGVMTLYTARRAAARAARARDAYEIEGGTVLVRGEIFSRVALCKFHSRLLKSKTNEEAKI